MMAWQSRRAARAAVMVMLLVVCAVGAQAVSASAASPIAPGFNTTATGFGFHSFEASLSGTQAGSHPDLTLAFELNREQRFVNGISTPVPAGGEVGNLTVNLPPGLAAGSSRCPSAHASSWTRV